MIASLKLLLRLFVLFSCMVCGMVGMFGFAAWLSAGGIDPAQFGAVAAAAVCYAAGMALLFGLAHVLRVRWLGYRLTDETLATRQRRQLTIELPFSETFTLCLASIRNLGGSDVEEETDYATGVILASKRWSLHSAGERLRFDLRQGDGGTDVVVESRPRWGTTLLDGGANARNVDTIVGFLLAHGAEAASEVATTRSEGPPGAADRFAAR